MAPVLSLKNVVDALEIVSSDIRVYINKNTGETRTILENDIVFWDSEKDREGLPDWEFQTLQEIDETLESEDWLPLPDAFTIHEYQIMKEFCYSIPDERLCEELLDKIRGSGAFRRFKDTIYRRGIEEQWFAFHRKALEEIAVEWLKENGLEYQ